MPSMTLLKLEPEETLYFCKTAAQSSPSRTLKLTNLSAGNVAFKVKTTAPKSYLVRPSSGTLRSRETQEVQIILQPQGSDGSANSHRFLVQAVSVTTSDQVTRDDWNSFHKENIQETKLSVIFDDRGEEAAAGGQTQTEHRAAPSVVSSGAPEGDLKVKYDELVQYTLMLEKEKKKLEADLAAQKSAKGAVAESSGWKTIHVLLVALFAALIAYFSKNFG
mmetsp:Transcript_62871/g.149909  ORF Transcript_62871/g.149909 Transcript_62871/m.149909 type:complete len:220 (-) Transcript_62871:146-805(-)|eukprot:CAMPEP_0178407148 /NCGR_PEP_ID=MMETSP0689_2-20121128/19278_1 /TAXON_ID=160604 /ORGANISM="Amphidinium massartii, Strain CS-259" /LENGTH=219 /DNA_ID=CAMNT_0020028211 /DNA_START=134 /DNA_END=793 /DNA_ORIENTATION=+